MITTAWQLYRFIVFVMLFQAEEHKRTAVYGNMHVELIEIIHIKLCNKQICTPQKIS